MQTFRTLEEVESAGLTLAVKKVVISCVKDLMDAYGEDFDADEVGGVVPLDRETIGDDTYELFDRKGVPAAMFGVMEGLLALGTDFR